MRVVVSGNDAHHLVHELALKAIEYGYARGATMERAPDCIVSDEDRPRAVVITGRTQQDIAVRLARKAQELGQRFGYMVVFNNRPARRGNAPISVWVGDQCILVPPNETGQEMMQMLGSPHRWS